MALPVTFNNTVFQAGFVGTDDGAPSANFGIDDVSTSPITVSGTVRAVGDPITVTGVLPGATTVTTTTFYATQYDSASMIEFNDTATNPSRTSTRLVLSNTQFPATGPRFTSDGDTTLNSYSAPVCFTTGTLVRTSRGDVAVEHLAVGDLAVTSSGEHRPIRWIGSRHTVTRRALDPAAVMPVRIHAGALSENRPARDLVVSPGHAICLDVLGEVLVPASALVNGSTIVQEDVDSVTYWHVELDSHDLLIAENQPAESYLDMGNRDFFGRGAVIDLDAVPDAAARTPADFCRPFHAGGALVEAVRAQLRLRAEALGWTRVGPETWADLHLEVDGRIMRPKIDGFAACFVLPADAQDVWLVYPTSIPCHVSDNPDTRPLGLRLAGLSLNDGHGAARSVALDDPRLCLGFYAALPDHRWTAGRAQLQTALREGMEGDVFLRLDLLGLPLPRWVAPEAAVARDAIPEAPRFSLVAA